MIKRGIDISAHQGNIDLSALKSEIDFVIIRAGFGTKGTLDQKFKRNADLCRELGIPVGFYWYSYALTIEDAKKEAVAFVDAISPYKDIIKYGAWFDMEDADGYKQKHGMPDNQTLRDMCTVFCEIVENSGLYAGVYASNSWFKNQLAGLNRFDKWVAQWPTSGGKEKGLSVDPNSRNEWHLWQFTSVGRFSGYKGDLDTNYAYTEFPNPGSQLVPEPIPTPAGSTFELLLSTLTGAYGDGEQRKSNLGTRYDEIQNIINHIASGDINILADEVINGQYGDGEQRKIILGDKYQEVQNKVNEKLGVSKSKKSIKKGDKVRLIGTRSYSGMHLAAWTHNSIFDVIEVSGDRVVIGKGGAVTSAVNIRDCELI